MTDDSLRRRSSGRQLSGDVDVDLKSFGDNHHAISFVQGIVPQGGAYEADLNPFQAQRTEDTTSPPEDESVDATDATPVLAVADEQGQIELEASDNSKNRHRVMDHKEKGPSCWTNGIENFKFLYSSALLIFSIIVVMTAICTSQTVATAELGVPAVVAFLVFWLLIGWLAIMEGGQGALVGLQPIDKMLYAGSHPRTLKNTTLVHKGDNLERFIVGRQFLVVLAVFVINLMASSIQGASVLGLPSVINDIFLATGAAVILLTITVGQLASQVNAATCMLDFANNYFLLFTIYVSLAIEFSGLLHAAHLIQILFLMITGKSVESKKAPRDGLQNAFFWIRVVFSLVVLTLSLVVTLTALFQGKTTMWEGVPEAVSVIIFFLLMVFVGMMEGVQIALFAVVNLPEEVISKHPIAYKSCKLTFRDQNLQAFLIGRQVCVTICMFVVAAITTIKVETGTGENIFGVSDGLQTFFNTGLLGAIITTILASLVWRIIASSFPIAFLSNPLIYLIIRLCLALQASGVCYSAWILARIHKQVAGYRQDEAFIGSSKGRATGPLIPDDLELQESAA